MPGTAATRLAAGTLALALPLTLAAGCGAQKKRTIKAEFTSARTNLDNSSAASFTLRLKDGKGNVKKLITKGGDVSAALADALVGGSITYVVDPVGDRTLKDVSVTTSSDASRLKEVNASFIVRDGTDTLAEIRLVAGTLYAKVNLKEIGRLAKEGGVEDFDAKLDEAVTSADPAFAQGLRDVRAGKWVKLPLADYLDRFKKLADSFGQGLGQSAPPTTKPFDAAGLGRRLYDGVKPYVKVTEAGDSSRVRVLDVKVQARPALKAGLKVLLASDDLPFSNVFKGIQPSEVDKNIAEGTANGTVTLKSGHLSQLTVDVESIRRLAVDPGQDSLAGTTVVFDMDDSAEEVTTPEDVSAFDLGAVLDQFLQGFSDSSGTVGVAVG